MNTKSNTSHEKADILVSFIKNNNIAIKQALLYSSNFNTDAICRNVFNKLNIPLSVLNAYPREGIQKFIAANNVDTILFHKRDIRLVNELLWICSSLKQYICIDTSDLSKETDGKAKLMNKKLWDFTAINAADDIEGGGWISSYTRNKFSRKEMDEYANNVIIKLKPYLSSTKRVVEIGCSSGITMFALAPYVKEYVALDISNYIIKKNKDRILRESISNIDLHCLYAHELNKLNKGKFDIGIANSVLQCFEGPLYFNKVFKMLIDIISNEGIIFFGDVMDANRKSELEMSLHEYKKKYKVNTKLDMTHELFFSKNFFEDLYYDYPEISNVIITDKHYSIENELTKFRYDVLIVLNKDNANNPGNARQKLQYACDIS